jgi:hypothetical protein
VDSLSCPLSESNSGYIMLKVTTNDYAPMIITFELTQPTVYLDYCVIVDLACNTFMGAQFRDNLLDKGGTLYLSWAHLVELFGLGAGPRYNVIRNYLASFERNFVLIDSDASAAIRRESEWKPGKQNPAIDEDFCRCLVQSWNGLTDLNVGLLLEIDDNREFFKKHQEMHRQHKSKLKQIFDAERNRYRNDRAARHLLDTRQYVYTPGKFLTQYILNQITRECVVSNEQFNPSDGLDFEHCIVSVAYCDFVALDQKWARRCKKIDLPPTAAKVFSIKETESLLREIKLWRG